MTNIPDALFDHVAALEFDEIVSDYETFCEWTQRFGDVEPFPESECGKLSISQIEQKWIVFEALCRHAKNEADRSAFFDNTHLMHALSQNGFAPSLEDHLRDQCESIWMNYTQPTPNTSSSYGLNLK